MCGIAGIINYQSNSRFADKAPVLLSSLRHRGPDAQATQYFSKAVLVHTRLAVIDIKHAHQPFACSKQRYHIVYNGEVYNHTELRSELEAVWPFKGRSDTEVVLAAYVHWGEKCLLRLNGMFAFFIWDEHLKVGFAARDLLGVKPFAYQVKRGEFCFASEAKALVAISQEPIKADREAIIEYLLAPYFSGVETSMFDGIEYLQPGYCLSLNEAGIQLRQWQDYQLCADIIAEQEYLGTLRQLITKAVERTTLADVPLATYLSGGFDSTLISSLIKKGVKKGETVQDEAAAFLKSYTVRFEAQAEIDYQQSLIVRSDDSPFASMAAEEIGLEQEFVDINNLMLKNSFSDLVKTNDALPAWEQEFAQYHLAQSAAKEYKVVLVGDAADETHWGYPFLIDEQATSSPAAILERFSIPDLVCGSKDVLKQQFAQKYEALAKAAGYSWETQEDRSLATAYLIVKRWLPRLLHNGDIHAMCHSLEARVPFADIDLLDFARKIHPQLGFKQQREKAFLRRACEGLLPEAIRTRPKSALPKAQSVARLYQHLAHQALLDAGEFIGQFLHVASLKKLCEPDRPLSEMERALLFRVISLALWQQHYEVSY